ncbi:MAG: PBECR2 nuclease fold domain-containing protein [Nanoarchaeota archaeon]
MNNIFEIKDKTGRKIHLSKERWKHITLPSSPHAHMTNYLEEIKQTLIEPDKIIKSVNNDAKVNCYRYYKERKQYLKVVVNYLNGDSFVITAYFTKNIN